jgi:flavin-binding protein dodecin
MSVAKVIELIAEGGTLEEAVAKAAAKASKTLRNVRSVNVENVKGLVENGKVVRYRVNVKATFVLED